MENLGSAKAPHADPAYGAPGYLVSCIQSRAKGNVSIEARFDGKEYVVRGSSLVDATAYTQTDRHNIAGVGKENGIVTLRETITAPEAEGGVLTLMFAILSEEGGD